MRITIRGVLIAISLGFVTACTPARAEDPPTEPVSVIESATATATIYEIPTITEQPTLTPDKSYSLTDTPDIDQTQKILFIGNSYTFSNNLPETLRKLMVAGGHEIIVQQVTNGGWSLSNHASSSDTINKITKTDWDYVILQEQSVVNNPEISMYPAVRDLHKHIERTGGETILFMTWGRKDGLESAGYPDYPSMQAQVAENYQTIASELSLTLAPVGLIWQVAIAQNQAIELWDADGSHPSKEGTYLAANVFYIVLTQERIYDLNFLDGLSENQAHSLQRLVSNEILGKPDLTFDIDH